MLQSGRLVEWTMEVLKADIDDRNWLFYLHKEKELSYEDWKKKYTTKEVHAVDKKEIANAMISSADILNSFNPG